MESRRTRRSGRDRRRPDIAALVEGLEPRQLLATAVLGTSLPDLTISGFAAPVASWGGALSITVNLQNIGSSQVIEPLALAPGSTSSADAGTSTVFVYAVRSPHTGLKGAVIVGQLSAPAVAQNALVQFTQTITLPQRPAGFPGDGGKVFLVLKANANTDFPESDLTNNFSTPIPVLIEAPLPELAVVGLDVPPVMQPGDTIQPNIRIANLGPADTAIQGPVQVALVASTTPTFNKGSSIVALYSVANVPSQSLSPSQGALFGDANLNPQGNIVTIAGAPVTLPATPGISFLGVVVDPFNQLKQLSNVPQFVRPRNPFSLSHKVGPPIAGLPPAGVDVAGGVANVPVFPNAFGGNPVGGLPFGAGFPVPFPAPSLASIANTTAVNHPGTITIPITTFSVSSGNYHAHPYHAARATVFHGRRGVLKALKS
jgi:hypothetical protein